MVTRDRLYQLIDALPEEEMNTAARVLEALSRLEPGEPFYTAETAPLDDEPETDEERAAVAEGEADVAAGRVAPAADLYRTYGH